MTELLPEEILRKRIHIRDPTLRNALSEFFGTALLLLKAEMKLLMKMSEWCCRKPNGLVKTDRTTQQKLYSNTFVYVFRNHLEVSSNFQFIGLSIVMQFILSGEKLNTWIQINVGWGLAITFCVYACSKTSGGHFNPAVSFTMYTLGRLSLKDFLIYCVVQTAGAFIGAIRAVAGPKATAACFCSFPAAHLSNITCFFDQVAGTGLLLFFVVVIIDKRNGIPAAAHPWLFGFVLIMIGTCMGMNLGYPINPARDLGPRLFAFFIYGSEVFWYHNYYFWIPIFAPFFGGALAAWTYQLFIGAHIPDPKEDYALDELKQPLRAT
ncbi:unnamed protein product [Nippostrongylus brasiliensis]|uniref:Aquaporin-9 n=1 Tax=Nippostrongylus brasiliensis TaxID=27835 RepID=A0A0N4Y348_NIPBR|nr:unnamed protein product [Nippostrongylus brasiliensis]